MCFFFRKKPLLGRILIKDMIVEMSIGAFDVEKEKLQRVRINLDLSPTMWPAPEDDDLNQVLSYDHVIKAIIALTQKQHYNLVETLAEHIASLCLANRRYSKVIVRVEKLDIYSFATPGVEIVRVLPKKRCRLLPKRAARR